MPFTVVSLHAHPDDEALLTAGMLARAAAEGHRVVLVTATAGEAGLAAASYGAGAELAARRRAELAVSAAALGCHRLEILDYADSGMGGRAGGERAFSRVDVDLAAGRVAALLREERADALTVYDERGGYGHPDHVAVHRVGVRAAELAGTPIVLEATVDRTTLLRAARLVHRLPGVPADFRPAHLAAAYTPRSEITHRVDVRRFGSAKRAAMRAHRSQSTADHRSTGRGTRTLDVFLRLPMPVFRAVFGREWFVERGRPAGKPISDIFATLR